MLGLSNKNINANIPVIFSVNSFAHNKLIDDARMRYASEIALGQKKVTYSQAIKMDKNIFGDIRSKLYKMNRRYGRDYSTELEKVKKHIESLLQSYGDLIDISVYESKLIKVFDSFAHDTESKIVEIKIDSVADESIKELSSIINKLFEKQSSQGEAEEGKKRSGENSAESALPEKRMHKE